MESKGFNENELSDSNKEALRFETLGEARVAVKTEIMHFTNTQEILDFEAVKVSKNDGVYGITWGRLVRDYLKTAYSGEATETEIVSYGVMYKVLKRGEVTVFYDKDGNTLFDVVNDRLEKEYDRLMDDSTETGAETTEPETGDEAAAGDEKENTDKEKVEADDNVIFMGTTSVAEAVMGLPAPTEEEIKATKEEKAKSAKEKAREKLEREREKAIEKEKEEGMPPFAESVIGYLLKRCKEDEGLLQDVIQEHKTWDKCLEYLREQALKLIKNRDRDVWLCIDDDVVFEWAEDYYHKNDKAEEEEKARKAAERVERNKKAAERRKESGKKKGAKKKGAEGKEAGVKTANGKTAEKPAPEEKDKKQAVPGEKKEKSKHGKKGWEVEGQMDLFSMMEM